MIGARKPRSWRARLAAVTVAVGLVTAGGSLSASAIATTGVPTKAQPPKVAPIGKYAVGMISETFVDGSRPTDANGDVPALPNRTLPTAIYYPTSGAPTDKPVENAPADTKGGPYPLILFSHGLYARGVAYEDVLKTWASAGYVVAAPDYPLSNTNARGGTYFNNGVADTKNQPADASFVINQVIKDKRFGAIIDPKRIGASGHSLGGITTYGLAYSACCRDKRIKAAIPMSGMGGIVGPVEQYFKNVKTPLLALHGNSDGTVAYQADMDTFTRAQAPKFFLTFLGAGHILPFLGGTDAQATALKQSTVDFFDYYLKNDKAGLDNLRTDANVAGSSTLQEQAGATPARAPATTAKR